MSENNTITNDNEVLNKFLAGRDVSCPTCGYNLRDLRGDQCPECGHSLEVTIRVNDGSMMRWVWAFASSCLSVPLGILYSIITVITLIESLAYSVGGYIWMYLFAGLFLGGTIIAIMLLIRKRSFLRKAVQTQLLLTKIIVSYNIVILSAFIIFVVVGR